MEGQRTEPELVPKQNTKSFVWTFFGFEAAEGGKPKDEEIVICRQCKQRNLDLAVVSSLKDETRVSRAFGVCRKLVSTFSHSWKKKRELMGVQQELGLPSHSLITDCPTRWGSKQKMVARLLEQEQAVRRVISEDRKTAHLIPTWQDIEVLESVQAALGPLADFTDMLSGEEHVTVSTIKPVLHLLKTKVVVESDGDTTAYSRAWKEGIKAVSSMSSSM